MFILFSIMADSIRLPFAINILSLGSTLHDIGMHYCVLLFIAIANFSIISLCISTVKWIINNKSTIAFEIRTIVATNWSVVPHFSDDPVGLSIDGGAVGYV